MQRLSDFDQASLRTYIQVVLAFPLAGDASAQTIYQHLRTSLNIVGRDFAVLSSNVQLQTSRFGEEAFLQPTSEIPLIAEIGGTNYANLAARGFPAQDFIRPDLDLNSTLKLNEGPVPVAHVRVKFIEGGLLLFLSINNSAADAYGLGQFVEAFAAATRGERVDGEPSSTVLHLPQDEEISSATLLTLSEQCPEFEVLLNPNPLPSLPDILPGGIPSEEIPSEAKIFVFKIEKIEQLREMVRGVWGSTARKPSAFVVFAALTWAHVTKARFTSESGAPPSGDSNVAKLFTPLDFRRRFHEETKGYFGNAVVTVPTLCSIQEVVEGACGDQNLPALAKLVAQITTTISDVDQHSVLRREALFRRVQDCRRLALSQDRRLPGQMKFNSHRYFGANFRWRIPGMGVKKPDSVRRITGEVSPGSALILPLNAESEVYELLLSIPTVSMSALLQDEDWMNLVVRVID